MTDTTPARDDFHKSVGTGEVRLKCDIGYKGIVIGQAYPIDNAFRDPGTEKNPSLITNKELRDARTAEEAERALGAHNRTIATYLRRFERFPTLPIESRFEANNIQLAETDVLYDTEWEQKVIETGVKKDGLSAEAAIYKYYKQCADSFRKSAQKHNGTDFGQKLLSQADLVEQIGVTHLKHLGEGVPSAIEDAPDRCIPVLDSLPAGILPFFYTDREQQPRITGCIVRNGTNKDHGRIIAASSGITVAQTLAEIRPGDILIIDGPNKTLILNPAHATIDEYKHNNTSMQLRNAALFDKSRATKIIKTKDEQPVKVSANIGFSNEMYQARNVGAVAVGLIRTELPFILGSFIPQEDEWYQIFSDMAEKADKMAWTLRVVDFEGDKKRNDLDTEKVNGMIREQIRAALRVKRERPETKVHIMIPTVGTVPYFQGMRDFYEQNATELLGPDQSNWPKFGCMVEIPAIIDKLDSLKADFLSIGTNDLIPRLLGFDRYDPKQADQYDPTDISVLRALKATAGHEKTSPVSLCGDMATDPRHIAILMGLGIRHLSVGVHMVPMVKEVVSRIDTGLAVKLIEDLQEQMDMDKEVRNRILRKFNNEIGVLADGSFNPAWVPPKPDAGAQPEPASQ